MSDFIVLDSTHCSVYLSQDHFNYTLSTQALHASGEAVNPATISKQIAFDVEIQKAEVNDVDGDGTLDAVLSTSDNKLRGIKGDKTGMTEIMEISLPEDVAFSKLEDMDEDGDLDIVLEYAGKALNRSKEFAMENNGGWKFE